MAKIIDLTLPEFAFVESTPHDGDHLYGRNVILHTRTASIVEVFDSKNVVPKEGVISFNFTNRNKLGLPEPLTMLLHYSATLDITTDKQEILKRVMVPAAQWYCDYCDWIDDEVIQ